MTARKQNKRPRVRIRCTVCGSDDVSRTAEVAWNPRRQAWALLTVYDDATCNECGGECSLYESRARSAAEVARELEDARRVRQVTRS